MSDGWFKIPRSLLNHPAFRGFQERWAFAELIALASWKPTTVRYKERVINLERGQLAISIRDFAKRIEWDKAKVERFFLVLKNQDMIETATETGVTLITICNYCIYQDCRDSGETPAERKPRQGRDTEQRREELKESKKDIYPPDLLFDDGNVTPLPKRTNGTKAGFADFWKAYPRREGKIAAEKAFDKAAKIAPVGDIMAGVSRAACHWQQTDRDREFIPLPATWLNQGRWCDEFEPPGSSAGMTSDDVRRKMHELGFD